MWQRWGNGPAVVITYIYFRPECHRRQNTDMENNTFCSETLRSGFYLKSEIFNNYFYDFDVTFFRDKMANMIDDKSYWLRKQTKIEFIFWTILKSFYGTKFPFNTLSFKTHLFCTSKITITFLTLALFCFYMWYLTKYIIQINVGTFGICLSQLYCTNWLQILHIIYSLRLWMIL